MKTLKAIILAFAFAPMAVFSPALLPAEETAGDVVGKLRNLSSAERQKELIEGAKREGRVVWYSSVQAQQIPPIVEEFNKRYPFVEVKFYRASGRKQLVKIQSEFRADRHEVDVINGNSENSWVLKEAGILDPHHSPQRKFFPDGYTDDAGFFAPTYIIPVVFGYNTSLVTEEEVPTGYQDLLDPQWKSRMLIDSEQFDLFLLLQDHYGREKGLQYFKKLAQQEPRLIRGRTAQAQLLMAGERAIAIGLHGHNVLDYIAKGAPIGWRAFDPYMSKANMTSLAKHAPHPYAAALFIDWLLSEEGQAKVATFGRVVARQNVANRFPALVEKPSLLLTPDMLGPRTKQAEDEFREIFMGS